MFNNHPDMTIPKFLDWVKTQPGNRGYDYVNNKECPVALYVKQRLGIEFPIVTPGEIDVYPDYSVPRLMPITTWTFPYVFDSLLCNGGKEQTFGELAKRLEEYIARQNQTQADLAHSEEPEEIPSGN